MTPDVVTLSVADHIATVTLDHPPVNAVNAAMRHHRTGPYHTVEPWN